MSHPLSNKGYQFEPLSYETLGACIDVQGQLGLHCKEVDYQRALALAIPNRGLQFQREVEIPISYDGVVITKRRVDFVVWDGTDELLLETKAKSAILPEDIEQCLLYLHQGGYRLCLLVNFGQKPLGVRRLVHTPDHGRRERGPRKTRKGIAKDAKGEHERHERDHEGRERDERRRELS